MEKFTALLNESIMPNVVDDAINNRYRVLINYDDEENHVTGTRLVEPYALGYTKANNLAFRGYQYNGASLRGVPKWKLFRLDRVISWKPTNQHFNIDPRSNGWDAEEYNNDGDNSMIRVINQVKFDNDVDDSYSPNNRLNSIRKSIDNIKKSQPIKIDDFNKSEPIENDSVRDVIEPKHDNKPKIDINSDEFRDMLNRNLAITDKEKSKRGFSLGGNKVNNINNDNKNIEDNNKGPVINDVVDDAMSSNNVNKDNNELSDFQKMLNRNLAITDREKAKRGFSLRDKKI